MINGKRVLAVIPARGGSKSIPYKNIKDLAGKPLLAWSIEVALACKQIDRVLVSTDDEKIADVATQFGAEVIYRSKDLARDDSLIIDTLKDLIKQMKQERESAEYLVMLEPTSPMRIVDDVESCLKLLADPEKNYDSVATFMEAELNPHRAWRLQDDTVMPFIDGAIPWLPRQKLPKAYQLTGAVYAFHIDRLREEHISPFFGKGGIVIAPKERSLDIDDIDQFEYANYMMRKRDSKCPD